MSSAPCAAIARIRSRPPEHPTPANQRAGRRVEGNEDRAHRLGLGPPRRPGNPRNRDSHLGAAARPDASGHGLRDRLAHRAMRVNQRGIDAEQVDLRLVAVTDDPAGDVVRAAGNFGQARQQQTTGARLGRREMPAALAQRGLRSPAQWRVRRRCRRHRPARPPPAAPPARAPRKLLPGRAHGP